MRRPLLWLLILYIALIVWRRSPPAEVGRPHPWIEVEGVVDSPLREDSQGWKAEVEAYQAGGLPFEQRLLVRWKDEPRALPGETVRLEGKLRRPRPARNPGDFDERGFLHDRGVTWVLHARTETVLDRPVAWRHLTAHWAERLHRSVRHRLRAALPLEDARLMEGFMLGYKGALSPDLAHAVQDAGLIHLIVPSGPKVALALLFCALLPLPPWGRLLAAAGAGLAIVLAAGGEAPYWRAYLVALLMGLGRVCDRESDAFQALILSAWLQLLVAPRLLFSAGFQMTYAALLGLAAYAPLLRRARSKILAVLAVSVVVQAALWPTFAQLFGRASVVGVLSNVVAVPCFELVDAAGWALWAASFAGLERAPAAACGWAAAAFVRLSRAAASLPGAAVDLTPWHWTAVAAYYAAFLGRSKKALAAAALLWLAGPRPAPMRVVELSVPPLKSGPRRAALVTFGEGPTWLVGRAPEGLVLRACRAYGIARIEGRLQSAIIALPSENHVRKPR